VSASELAPRVTARRLIGVLALLTVALAAVLVLAVAVGVERVSFRAALDPATIDHAIVVDARLLRVLLAAAVGAALAGAGLVFQALLRNPLADPFVLGVEAGGAVGATLAIVTGAAWAPLLPLWAFAGSLATVAVVYAVGRVRGRLMPQVALLAGVVLNAFSSGLVLALTFLLRPARANEVMMWLVGSLGSPELGHLVAVGAWMLVGFACIVALAPRMNALALGDEGAHSLGIDVHRTRRALFLAASLMVGASVAVAGPIAFVGIIVPHTLRLLFGPDHRLLAPACALGGALFLALCDTGARLLFVPLGTEPAVGVITVLVGGPFFLVLLWKRRDGRLF
jgi:iron complex transport system permease protein